MNDSGRHVDDKPLDDNGSILDGELANDADLGQAAEPEESASAAEPPSGSAKDPNGAPATDDI